MYRCRHSRISSKPRSSSIPQKRLNPLRPRWSLSTMPLGCDTLWRPRPHDDRVPVISQALRCRLRPKSRGDADHEISADRLCNLLEGLKTGPRAAALHASDRGLSGTRARRELSLSQPCFGAQPVDEFSKVADASLVLVGALSRVGPRLLDLAPACSFSHRHPIQERHQVVGRLDGPRGVPCEILHR